MTALIIIACVIAVLVLLILTPVRVRIEYDDDFRVRVYYLIKIVDTAKKSDKKGKKHKNKPQENKNKKKEIFIVRDFHGMGKIEFIKYYAGVLRDILKELVSLIKRFKIKIFDFNLAVGCEDAYDTALQYGAVSAAVNPVLHLLFDIAKVKAKKINIFANFTGGCYYFNADIKLSVKLIFLLVSAKRLIKIYRALDKGTYKKDNEKPNDKTLKESVKNDE